MLMHKIVVALIVITSQTSVFIQIHCLYFREIKITFFIPLYKFIVCSDRCRSRCKTEYTIRFQNYLCGKNICRFSTHFFIILCFINFHIFRPPIATFKSNNLPYKSQAERTLFLPVYACIFLYLSSFCISLPVIHDS